MSKFLEKLRDERNTTFTAAQTLIDLAAKEERELTDDERKENDTRFSRLESIDKQIDDHTKFAKLKLASGQADTGTEIPGKREFDASEGRSGDPVDGDPSAVAAADRHKFNREVQRYLTTGEEGPMARRFATVTTTSQSGLFLPRLVGQPIAPPTLNAFRQAYALNGLTPLETPTTAAYSIPVLDANAGSILAENASTDSENNGASESINLSPKTFQSGSAWFSNQMIAANNFDIWSTMMPTLVQSKELALESAIAAALIADSGITQTVAAATVSGYTYANLADLEQRLPAKWNQQKAIILSADGFKAATKLVGSDGHPVLLNDPQNQNVARLFGTPVIRSDFLEAFGANKVIGVVISLLGFRLRDVTIQNLEKYAAIPTRPNQVGANLFAYHGYGWAPTAVAKLVCPAS